MALREGDKAPDFQVNDEAGNLVRLSDLRGKKVVLFFYPKDMTEGCTAEACNLRDNYKLLLKQGYEVLGISTDDEKSHQKFIAKENLPFRLLADTDRRVHEAYDTWGEKSMYGRTYMGTLRTTFIIDEQGVIEEIIRKVDTRNHTHQILKDVAAGDSAPVALSLKEKTPAKKAQATKTAAKKTARTGAVTKASVSKKTGKKKS